MEKDTVNREYMLPKEAADYLRTTKRKILTFRRMGLLPAVRFGKTFVFSKECLDKFVKDWNGYDLSNERKILEAINERNWITKHERRTK